MSPLYHTIAIRVPFVALCRWRLRPYLSRPLLSYAGTCPPPGNALLAAHILRLTQGARCCIM